MVDESIRFGSRADECGSSTGSLVKYSGVGRLWKLCAVDGLLPGAGRAKPEGLAYLEAVRALHECPHLKIEIWGTRFCGFNQMWATCEIAQRGAGKMGDVSDRLTMGLEAMEGAELHAEVAEDEVEIRGLIERWAKAVRDEDRAGIRADHDDGILMFDVPPPLLSRGLDAYMATWETFFSAAEKPVAFAFDDVEVSCGEDVGFATAVGRCVNTDRSGKREPLEFRLTMGLRKVGGHWRVMHEHHSLPAM
jgi:ketosteroid isomerase-like protein